MKVQIMLKKVCTASLIVLAMTGCSNTEKVPEGNVVTENTNNGSEISENTVSDNGTSEEVSALKFPINEYTVETITVDGQDVTYRAYEQIVYVANPVDTQYQSMNIYIPEAYFNGESIGGFTAETAPIFFPNNVGSYLPAEPGTPSLEGAIDGEASRVGLTSNGKGSGEESPNSLLMALSKGYVVASPGARGRTLQAEDGTYTGKAPAAIVDLKAAVRYLYYNDGIMPGTAEKIISNGTSAGGGLSTLLGASGNNADYEPYLEELGAADASDAIFAVSAYCPITNLENADMGYEWLFNGINEYEKMNITRGEDGQIQRQRETLTLTSEQTEYSTELKQAFTDYVNSLNLTDTDGKSLTLDANGEGSFKDYITSFVMTSAQAALDSGKDLSKETWITIEGQTVTAVDFDGYIEYLGRSKGTPAFDAIDLSQPENSLFGTELIDTQHFTAFSFERDTTGGTMADEEAIKLMNPMNYIGTEGTDVAQYWRIRHGLSDSDTAVSTPVILSSVLESTGVNVDFTLPWGQGHGGDYDLEELFTWMDSVVNNA